MRRQRGWTLIESMIAATIVGILFAVACGPKAAKDPDAPQVLKPVQL